ncbi:centromere protein I-like [Ictidomys tridecemlineatus]|nr:centromere protein I-like [Ictidomys tridecemlineatus]
MATQSPKLSAPGVEASRKHSNAEPAGLGLMMSDCEPKAPLLVYTAVPLLFGGAGAGPMSSFPGSKDGSGATNGSWPPLQCLPEPLHATWSPLQWRQQEPAFLSEVYKLQTGRDLTPPLSPGTEKFVLEQHKAVMFKGPNCILQPFQQFLGGPVVLFSVHKKTHLETTLGGSMDSVSKLIDYVGWLSTTAMRLESNSTFLLHFILDFYEKPQKVCDIYVNYNLPLVVLFPPGIFHSALLSLDTSILNQLCYIMHRYHKNLSAAKKNELVQKAKSEFNFSSKTYQQFNQYLTTMVGCLWTSKPFEKGTYIDLQILESAGIMEYKNSLNLVCHPSLLSYAASFLLQENLEERTINMGSIRGKKWNWYLEYLFSEGLQGLKLFIGSNIHHSSVP